MSDDVRIKSSLEVGFAAPGLPDKLVRFRGAQTRALEGQGAFPYEDRQFDVVLLAASRVSPQTVREAHRVLKSDGRLLFVVPEETRKQPGWTIQRLYSLLREGFDIVDIARPHWWSLLSRARTLSVRAHKKAWKAYRGLDCRHLTTHALFSGVR